MILRLAADVAATPEAVDALLVVLGYAGCYMAPDTPLLGLAFVELLQAAFCCKM